MFDSSNLPVPATAAENTASSLYKMNFLRRALFVLFVLTVAVPIRGQTANAGVQPATHPSSPDLPSGIVQNALSEVESTTSALNISRWKAPGSVREAAQANVDSIQRDLGNTLPTLLAQADAASGSVPLSFAVYRNVDALYDVLLRVSQTADLAAPSDEAASVASALQKLEEARSRLGDAIVQTSQQHEARLVALEQAAKKPMATPAAAKTETVIDDGPVRASARSTKKRRASRNSSHKPPAGTPAASPSN